MPRSSVIVLPSGKRVLPSVISNDEATAYKLFVEMKNAWDVAGKHVFKGLRRAFMDPEVASRVPENILLSPDKLLRLVPAAHWAGARNVEGIFKELGKLDCSFVVHWDLHDFDNIAVRINVVKSSALRGRINDPKWGTGSEIPASRVPGISGALERATGMKWRFGEGTLSVKNAKQVLRAAHHAYRIPEVKEQVSKVLSQSPNPFKVEPHVPFRVPRLGFAPSFKAGRIAGFKHVVEEVGNLATIWSFASFLRGDNPGFVAQVLFKSPMVALPLAFAINWAVGRHKRRKAQRAFDAAFYASLDEYRKAQGQLEALKASLEAQGIKRQARRVRHSKLTGRDVGGYLNFARYGGAYHF